MRVVAFLQNAWSPAYTGRDWPYGNWVATLWRSRSGRRLATLVDAAPSVTWWWDNPTPEVGPTPDSVLRPDEGHIRKVLRE